MKSKIVLILPAFNEHKFLPGLIKSIRKYTNIPVVVVDDGSMPKLLVPKQKNIYSIKHKLNLGKGMAMSTGAEFAFNQLKSTAVIFMDADGQHDPKYIPQFVDLLSQKFDIVFGSRSHTAGVPLVRYLGNKFASIYINLIFGAYVSDILSGFRALSKKAYTYLRWTSERYGVETEMVARLGKYKKILRYTEIPISNIYIDKYKGVTLLDAVKILLSSIWWKLS